MSEEEQREAIISTGAVIRADLLGLLSDAYKYRPGFIVGGKQLSRLEKRFGALHGKFLHYDGRIFEFLSDTEIGRGKEPWAMELRHMGWEKLANQRQIVQSLLDSINAGLSNAHAQLINKRAILIAFIALASSIILGLISIYVALVSQPIIVYPVGR